MNFSNLGTVDVAFSFHGEGLSDDSSGSNLMTGMISDRSDRRN